MTDLFMPECEIEAMAAIAEREAVLEWLRVNVGPEASRYLAEESEAD